DGPLRLAGHEGEVRGAAFSPDGRRLVTGSDDRTVRVWDVASGAAVVCLRGHTEEVSCVAFSPDGGRGASGSAGRTVRVWDLAGAAEIACVRIEDPGVWQSCWSGGEVKWEKHAVRRVAFSRDGRHLLTLSDSTFHPGHRGNPRARVWEPGSGVCVRSFEGR